MKIDSQNVRYLLSALEKTTVEDYAMCKDEKVTVSLPFKDNKRSDVDIKTIASMALRIIEIQDKLIYEHMITKEKEQDENT